MRPNGNQFPPDNYADLDDYGTDYAPRHLIALNVKTLPNGDYDCVIQSASLEKLDKGQRIVRINLQLATGGVVEWTHWLSDQNAVNGLCADLRVLGFDSHQWGPLHRRPLSVEIPKAVAKLPGYRFRGHKSSSDKTTPPGPGLPARTVTYHDFRVLCRLGQGTVTQPAAQPANGGLDGPAGRAGQGVPVGAGNEDDDRIPF